MVESAPLLREYTSKGYRGFESLPVRQTPTQSAGLGSGLLVEREDLDASCFCEFLKGDGVYFWRRGGGQKILRIRAEWC